MTSMDWDEPGEEMVKDRRVKKKRMAMAAGVAAGLLGGGAAGLAFTGTAVDVSAQSPSTAGAGAADDPTTTTTAPGATAPRPDRTAKLNEVLKPLVDKGTITQAQADEVIKALEAAGPGEGSGRGHRDGGFDGGPDGFGRGPGGPGRVMGPNLDAVAKVLGITADELKTALRDGKSLKDIAADKKVDVQKIVDALVAEAKTHLDAAVKDGRITQAQADERLKNETDMITKMVNGELPKPFDHRGPGDDGPPPPGDGGSSTAPSTAAPTTTAAAGGN